MCLAIPGRIVGIESTPSEPPKARVEYSGTVRTASLAFLPEVQVGDYIVVQSGFAIRRLSGAEAEEILDDLEATGATAGGSQAAAVRESTTAGTSD